MSEKRPTTMQAPPPVQEVAPMPARVMRFRDEKRPCNCGRHPIAPTRRVVRPDETTE